MKRPTHFNLLIFCLVVSSCSSYRQQSELIGELERDPGAVIQEPNQPRDYERYGITPDALVDQEQSSLDSAASRTTEVEEYPVAGETNNPDMVISPFPPNSRISVKGLKSGALARDPGNMKIFRVP